MLFEARNRTILPAVAMVVWATACARGASAGQQGPAKVSAPTPVQARTPQPVGARAGQPTSSTWERIDLPPEVRWHEHTHALAIGDTVWFLHGQDMHVRNGEGKWRALPKVLPAPIGPFAASCVDRAGRLLVVPGGNAPGFTFDPRDGALTSIPALARPTQRGAMVCVDDRNVPYLAEGGREPAWGRVVDGAWEDLPKVATVTPIGAYSAGLFAMPEDVLVAFGDHHVGKFFVAKNEWPVKSDLFVQLGFRPALDRGGMCAQDPLTRAVYMTLGKGSRSFGVMTPQKQFFHLRPRLPIQLSDPDRSLWITNAPSGDRLNLLSREHAAILSIPIAGLTPIGVFDRIADTDSRFEVTNSRTVGSVGDLARERDSTCSLVFVPPYVYIQRKLFVRQVDVESLRHSPPDAGYRYGDQFVDEGSALCFDGDNAIYVYNGITSRFWRLQPFTHQQQPDQRAATPVPLADALVTELAPIPEWAGTAPRDGRGRNTATAACGTGIYALFEPTTRRLWRYDPPVNRWTAETILPAGVPFNRIDGAQLTWDGERLWLCSKNVLIDYQPGSVDGFGERTTLPFTFSQDGGTTAFDRARGLIYVAIGGGSRDLGVIRLRDRKARLLTDFFPDVVSVPGHRMFVYDRNGATWLHIFRGHDSAEYWRTKVSGDGELKVD
ncbi:MAG: hypothetical protein IPK26_17180 [Planctomycetes bacterium]|nr:hypothetical protein [Planctomycetota bacterium]